MNVINNIKWKYGVLQFRSVYTRAAIAKQSQSFFFHPFHYTTLTSFALFIYYFFLQHLNFYKNLLLEKNSSSVNDNGSIWGLMAFHGLHSLFLVSLMFMVMVKLCLSLNIRYQLAINVLFLYLPLSWVDILQGGNSLGPPSDSLFQHASWHQLKAAKKGSTYFSWIKERWEQLKSLNLLPDTPPLMSQTFHYRFHKYSLYYCTETSEWRQLNLDKYTFWENKYDRRVLHQTTWGGVLG